MFDYSIGKQSFAIARSKRLVEKEAGRPWSLFR